MRKTQTVQIIRPKITLAIFLHLCYHDYQGVTPMLQLRYSTLHKLLSKRQQQQKLKGGNKMTKRFLAILATLLVAVFVLAACGGNEPATTPEDSGTTTQSPTTEAGGGTPTPAGGNDQTPAAGGNDLVVAVGALAVSMDPIVSNDSASALNNNMLFSTLVNMNEDTFEVEPALAVSWEMPDAATVNMTLREGVVFHNGDPLTAHDVKFSLERAGAAPEVEPIVGMINNVTVIDDLNFTIHLDFPFAPILRHLAHTTTGIVPADHVNAVGEAAFADHPIGTGPFAFSSITLGDRVEMVRNDNYWGDVPRVDTLTFRMIPDQSGRLIAVETGEVHIADALAPADISVAEASPNVTLERRMNLSTNYVGFNTQRPYLDNPLVRQAINYAIDGHAIVDLVLMGTGAPANGPIANIVWGYHSVEPFNVNIDRARELMAEAGLEDGFSTTIWYNIPNAQRQAIAEMVQFALQQLNIEVEVIGIEWAQYLEATSAGEHDMFILGWVSVTGDADYGLFPLFHSSQFGSAGNRTFWSTPEMDALLEAGRLATEDNERLAIYAEAQQILRDEAPWIFLNQGETLMATAPNLQNFTIAPWGHHNFAKVWFD